MEKITTSYYNLKFHVVKFAVQKDTYIQIYKYICIQYIHTYIYIYIYIYMCMCVCVIYVCVCVFIYIFLYINIVCNSKYCNDIQICIL